MGFEYLRIEVEFSVSRASVIQKPGFSFAPT